MSEQPDRQAGAGPPPLALGVIFKTWWPLAASWMLMAFELPLVSAVVARLPQPEVSLAAWGGVIFPISLIIESPIIMLLAASTALSRDGAAYLKLRAYMMRAGAALTGLHVLVAFTPLYDVVVGGWIGAPAEIIEPARLGLRLMTPWTWSIAYRRFHQGVLIRFDHSDVVGIGTGVRLAVDASVLLAGLAIGSIDGVAVAGAAVALGVMAEAVYTGLRARPVVRDELMPVQRQSEPIQLPVFLTFYLPLALTSMLSLLIQPLGSAALSRMPLPLESLAVWPVLSGLVFMSRSLGMAYNEVVVALLDRPRAYRSLRRFTLGLAGGTTLLLVAVAVTPLSRLWFERVSGLSSGLADLGIQSLFVALPLPALVVLQSWFQGVLVHERRTRPVTEAVGLGLVVTALVLILGVAAAPGPGLSIVWFGFTLGGLVQVFWLWRRSSAPRRSLSETELQAELPHLSFEAPG